MVTGTLSSLVSRLVNRSKNTDLVTSAAHVKHENLYPTETTIFLASYGDIFIKDKTRTETSKDSWFV